MRHIITTILLFLIACSDIAAQEAFDWEVWRALPVQNGGRQKPLDTLGRETLRSIANRSDLADPDTHNRLDSTALYLTMLFEWRGWEHPDQAQLELVVDWRPLYFHLHQADKWDRTPLLRIDFLPLRTALGLDSGHNYVSPLRLNTARIEDRRTRRELPFSAWADKLLELEEADEELNELEQKGLELANRFWSYQNHRMGRTLEALPIQAGTEPKWIPVAHLMLSKFDNATDPSGDLRKIQQLFGQARQSFLEHDATTFNRTSKELLTNIRRLGSDVGYYPSQKAIALEVAYNQWAPFRIGWILMLLAAIGMLLYWGSLWTSFYIAGLVSYVGSLIAVVIGFTMRIAISGRPPVTNMYESVIYVGAGIMMFGLVFELIYRKKYVISAASAVATIALVLADNCPLVLDASMRPLEPVLRSNFWLVTHVMTITLSYAAFALALGIANITLGYYLIRSDSLTAIRQLSRFTYKAIQTGVLLLSAGVILGGVWADYSWGRFWGWDPKEVWALVALLGYLAVLHARFAGWVGHRGLAALSVACFSLVVMAWYGVNFVLGAGLHSYGFGGGGQGYVYVAVVLQLSYVAASLLRSTDSDGEIPGESVSQARSAPLKTSGMSVTA